MIIRCGEVTLDFARYEASRSGKPVHLRPKIFSLLGFLAERRDRVVLKQEIHDYLWADQMVGDSALDTSIKEARRLLGDSGSDQRVIKTIRGLGFRFVGEIEILDRFGERPSHRESLEESARAVRPSAPLTSATSPQSRPISRFVGRSADLESLVSKLQSAQRGRGRVVGIVGESGQGKTRLLAEFRSRTSRRRYISGRCYPNANGCSSPVITEMLREQCGIGIGDDLETAEIRLNRTLQESCGYENQQPDWSAFLLHLLGLETAPELNLLGPRALQFRTFEALHKVFIRSSAAEPVVVAIDDLNWIDSFSESWLEWLQRSIVGLPILLLAAYRPGYTPNWIGRSYASQLALEPLADADSKSLVEEALPKERRSEAVVRTIVQRARGNPFFLEELARSVGRDEVPALSADVPDSILTFVAARVSRLLPSARTILETLAVVGSEAPYSMLKSLTSLSDQTLHEQLSLLVDHEFLIENLQPAETVYSFQHSLIRDAAYRALPNAKQKSLHERVARVLASDYSDVSERYPDRLAHHFAKAGMGEEFAHYWIRANAQALSQRFVDQAADYLRRGLGVVEALPESPARDQQELNLCVNLAGALNMAGNNDDATVVAIMDRAEELRERLVNSPPLYWALSAFVRHHLFRGEMRNAERMTERLRECSEHIAVPEVQRLTTILYPTYMSLIRFYMGETEQAHHYAECALSQYEPAIYAGSASLYLHDPGILSRVYAGAAALLCGRPRIASEQCVSAIATARSLAQPWNLAAASTMAAHVASLCSDHEAAVQHGELAEAVCQEQGLRTYGAFVKGVLGWEHCAAGNAGEIVAIQKSLESMKRSGWNLMRTGMLVYQAAALAMTGRLEEGLGALAEAESLFAVKGERYMEPEVYRTRGELLLQKGMEYAELAEALFRQALRTANARKMRWWELRAAISLARLWRRLGKASEGRELVGPIFALFDENYETPDLAAARMLLQ